MTLFNRIRTFTLTALTATMFAAPACDDGSDYEALGVSVEDLEAMSDEELAALDAELELDNGRFVTHHPHVRPEVVEELRNPIHWTHTERPDHVTKMGLRPRPTHTERPDHVTKMGLRPRPTHAEPADALAADADEPPSCDTHGDEELALVAE